MLDILICSVPSGIINRPPAAPAVLKACAINAGFTARTADLSLNFFINQCHSDYSTYSTVSKIFEPYIEWSEHELIQDWLTATIEMFRQTPCRYVALSVFSNYQHKATVLLCETIRKVLPDVKIVLGGHGLTVTCKNTVGHLKVNEKINSLCTFDSYIRKHNLADHVIYGEGESQLVDLLNGQELDTKLVELESVPPGNFDDYLLDQYLWHTEPVLLITGSKGCVRSCTFCNVPRTFGRYRRKSGKTIANEMIKLSEKYNITKFEFTDSLVNGSQLDFVEFINELSEYNRSSLKPITWYGQYICRPQSQIPKDIYKKIKESGAVHLIIGAESGSNDVLAAMNKKMTVQDMYNELDQFAQHGLQAQLLILNGFYNETIERFNETLMFIAKCHKYLASGTISRIAVGFPLAVEPGGYLDLHADELGIIIDPNNPSNWTVKDDPTNIWLERVRRKLVCQALLNKMNVTLTGNGILELGDVLNQLELYEQQLRSSDPAISTRLSGFTPH